MIGTTEYLKSLSPFGLELHNIQSRYTDNRKRDRFVMDQITTRKSKSMTAYRQKGGSTPPPLVVKTVIETYELGEQDIKNILKAYTLMLDENKYIRQYTIDLDESLNAILYLTDCVAKLYSSTSRRLIPSWSKRLLKYLHKIHEYITSDFVHETREKRKYYRVQINEVIADVSYVTSLEREKKLRQTRAEITADMMREVINQKKKSARNTTFGKQNRKFGINPFRRRNILTV